MIYTVDNKKYKNGNRAEKTVSLKIEKLRRYRLNNAEVPKGAQNVMPINSSKLSENNMLYFVKDGRMVVNGKTAAKGSVLFVARFSVYDISFLENFDVYEVFFGYSGEMALFDEKVRTFKIYGEAFEYVEKMYKNSFCKSNIPGVNEGLLLNIINTLNMMCEYSPEEINLYQKCREWIEENAYRNITAKMAAEAMGCTAEHLNRMVKKHSGSCLSEIIAEMRINEIKKCIKNNITFNDMANRLDFGSVELMRKFFKYHTGISPKEYKESLYLRCCNG